MKVIQDDLWLCSDCTQAAVNDDYSGLDYYYQEPEASERMACIQHGLEILGTHLVLDNSDDQFYCHDCYTNHDKKDLIYIPNPDCKGCPDENMELCDGCNESVSVKACPSCKSVDVTERESGEDEFSKSQCDCCGTYLAGSRTRFAILGEE